MSRALVLGGGGPVGIGWESGLVTGFVDAGIPVPEVDLVVGTSAGSVVGAQLTTGLSMPDTLALAAEPLPVISDEQVMINLATLVETLRSMTLAGASFEETRRAVGRVALEAPAVPEERYVELFSPVDGIAWPDRYCCTAVDAETGEFRVWDAGAGVPLQRAVASSCAVPGVFPPVTIKGRRYMDGGMNTGLNALVASGHDVVLALSCAPLALPEGLDDPVLSAVLGRQRAELDQLTASGAKLEVVEPNAEFLEISGWGLNLMDVTRVDAAYEAGRRQALDEAARVGAHWER